MACLPLPCSWPLCGKHPWVTQGSRCAHDSCTALCAWTRHNLPSLASGGSLAQRSCFFSHCHRQRQEGRKKNDDFTKPRCPPKNSFNLEAPMFLVFLTKIILEISISRFPDFQNVFLGLAHFFTEIESKNPWENNEAPGVSLLTSASLFPWSYINRNLPPQPPLFSSSDRGIGALEVYSALKKKKNPVSVNLSKCLILSFHWRSPVTLQLSKSDFWRIVFSTLVLWKQDRLSCDLEKLEQWHLALAAHLILSGRAGLQK